MVVHPRLIRPQQYKQEPDGEGDLCQVVEDYALGESYEGHGRFVQVINTSHQYGDRLRVLWNAPHDVLDVLLSTFVRSDTYMDIIRGLQL